MYPLTAWGQRKESAVNYGDIPIRGTIVNRTYGIEKNQYIQPFLLRIFGPINYGPP